MARVCEVCGKRSEMGNTVETRGKAKYLGGVGTKITGISRRQFKPNLQRVKITTPGGANKTVRVCTQCIRSGAVRKAVKHKPFQLPADAKTKDQPKDKGKSKKGAKAADKKRSGAKAKSKPAAKSAK